MNTTSKLFADKLKQPSKKPTKPTTNPLKTVEAETAYFVFENGSKIPKKYVFKNTNNLSAKDKWFYDTIRNMAHHKNSLN